jgi:hypothetical protein
MLLPTTSAGGFLRLHLSPMGGSSTLLASRRAGQRYLWRQAFALNTLGLPSSRREASRLMAHLG